MAGFYDDNVPADVRSLTDAQAIDKYLAGADVPGRAVAGLSLEQLNSFPVPGTWSIQQIIIHLLDSDLMAAVRMKRAIAEDRPRLEVYDETAFAQRLGYDKLSTRAATELFRSHRLYTAEILRNAPADAFRRVALHPEIGEVSVGQIVRIYAHHVDHHLAYILKKRKLLGAELAL
jgi:hypothetical protein